MKKLIAITIGLMLIIPSTTVMAKEKKGNSYHANKNKRAYRLDKNRESFLIKELEELKKKLTKITDENTKLKSKSKVKNNMVDEKIKKIYSSRKLSSKDLDKIQNQLNIVKEDTEELKKTLGSVKIEYNIYEYNGLSNNYEESIINLQNMINIQNKRNLMLVKLNQDLDTLLKLLK